MFAAVGLLLPHIDSEVEATDPGLVEAICRALALAGLSQKAAAVDMGLDPPHWSRALHVTGPNLNRLIRLGPAFWRAFYPRLGALVGVAPQAADLEARIARLESLIGQRRAG